MEQCFFSVLIVLFLWHASAISTATVGLIVHVILGHTLFVSGTVLGFHFYLNGLFLLLLLLLAWLTIAMEGGYRNDFVSDYFTDDNGFAI